MTKVRISCDTNLKVRQQIDVQAKENGISRAKFIENAVESKLEGFNVHKENKRLTEARRQAEEETEALRQQLTTAEQEHKNLCNQLEREKTELTEQRDEFEKLLHAETDAYNTCYERAESLKKERDTFKAAAEEARKQRDSFKAKFEDAESNYRTCSEKLRLLLTRNWWERLWNKMPLSLIHI